MNNTKAKDLVVGDSVYVYQEWFKVTEIAECDFFPRSLTFMLSEKKEVSWMEEADVFRK
jgi:hypothetical protein|tara:strand:+ start:1051 stop:1227 length:177 start_codon:yes stop_codon:yes gene_type:complete